jgi:hypothetical protein
MGFVGTPKHYWGSITKVLPSPTEPYQASHSQPVFREKFFACADLVMCR